MLKKIFIILVALAAFYSASAQTPGDEPPRFNPDTVFIFKSPRPLIMQEDVNNPANNAWGLDVFFSESGFGMGAYLQKYFSKDFSCFANMMITGARNKDEFEQYICNTETGDCDYKVWNKVNRLYAIPFTLGAQYNLFAGELTESFRPFVSAGLGTALIAALPYDREFFSSFKYAGLFLRFASFAGVGANFSIVGKSVLSFNARYYYIPFGGDGLESIKNAPMTNFGGIFLSLSFGIRY
jgi:hypothetical protein